MAINMGAKPSTPMPEATVVREEELEVVPYDIQADKQQVEARLQNSQVIEDLTALIDISNLSTIVTFGAEVAEELAKSSDVVLNNMSVDKINESSKMLDSLGKIMSQFDIDEIKEEDQKNLFNKIFKKAQKKIDEILSKYQTMGAEVDKIYVVLKQYEDEIHRSNQHLETIFKTNVDFYHNLLEYIVAGEQGVREIEAYLQEQRDEMARTGDTTMQFEITTLEQASQMLQQRTQDLRIAESVALQSIPMIRTMQFSNINLIRKINSAFIITLPVFKQALAQAIMLKRQKIQAEAMSALDEKTNEMLLKNANNTVAQAKLTAQLASTSSIKVDTLEQTWKIIRDGIEETKRIQDEAVKEREADKVRLNSIKEDFNKSYSVR
ncbi:MAG: hypothetical protein ATN35_08235 [Epulopiscium sp. Nele67-Bin004]|nr:MAG: hypothetical protein ATN35_08235 [Epulopiscium sp. Nele67-Bin004]